MGEPVGEGGNRGERIFLGIGSNLGDRLGYVRQGLKGLEDAGILPLWVSSLYETEPVGYLKQGDFLNLVAEVVWAGGSRGLLEGCLAVEGVMGRVRGMKDAPRTLDIDILLWGNRIQREAGLEIPHPRLHERRFVLVPLEEIAPDLFHPVLKHTIRELLDGCPDRSDVRRSPLRVALERGDPSGYNPAASGA